MTIVGSKNELTESELEDFCASLTQTAQQICETVAISRAAALATLEAAEFHPTAGMNKITAGQVRASAAAHRTGIVVVDFSLEPSPTSRP